MKINLVLLLFGFLQSLNAIVFISTPPETFGKIGLPMPQGDIYNRLLGALWLTLGLSYFVGACNNNFTRGMLLLGMLNAAAEVITYCFVCRQAKEPTLRIALMLTITIMAALGFACLVNLFG